MVTAEQHAARIKAVIVTVNNRMVEFEDNKATGEEIKATAIAQGVAIQSDFLLYEVKDGGNLKQVDDGEQVTLHPNQRFSAVAPDDNS